MLIINIWEESWLNWWWLNYHIFYNYLHSTKYELRLCADSTLLSACWRFRMVRISDNGPRWKDGVNALRQSSILQKELIIVDILTDIIKVLFYITFIWIFFLDNSNKIKKVSKFSDYWSNFAKSNGTVKWNISTYIDQESIAIVMRFSI